MAQAGRITWDEFQIPQASSTTFAKSGGFTSAGSVGGDKGAQQARSGGTTSAASTGASRIVQHVKTSGVTSAGSLGASRVYSVARDGGIELGGVLSASQAKVVLRDGGIASGAQTGAQWLLAASKDGGIEAGSALGGDSSASFARDGGTVASGALGADVSYTPRVFSKDGGFILTFVIGGDVVPATIPVQPPAPDTGSPGQIVQRRRLRQKAPVKRKSVRQQHEAIENHAERLLKRGELPDYFTKGAQKAYKNMQEFYGPLDGRRIFIKKAIEQGHGSTLTDKINDVYATGTTVDTRKKLQTRVQTRGVSRPQVKILSRIGK